MALYCWSRYRVYELKDFYKWALHYEIFAKPKPWPCWRHFHSWVRLISTRHFCKPKYLISCLYPKLSFVVWPTYLLFALKIEFWGAKMNIYLFLDMSRVRVSVKGIFKLYDCKFDRSTCTWCYVFIPRCLSFNLGLNYESVLAMYQAVLCANCLDVR